MSDEKLFTVEYDAEGEAVQIHLNRRGRDALIELLTALGRNGGHDDRHLFTEDWGGAGLSGPLQGQGNTRINHLEIFFWDQDTDDGAPE